MKHTPKYAILDRIKRAETAEEIEHLLKLGESLQGASIRTRVKWKRHAKKRKQEIIQ